jgi:hypothetical protein
MDLRRRQLNRRRPLGSAQPAGLRCRVASGSLIGSPAPAGLSQDWSRAAARTWKEIFSTSFGRPTNLTHPKLSSLLNNDNTKKKNN